VRAHTTGQVGVIVTKYHPVPSSSAYDLVQQHPWMLPMQRSQMGQRSIGDRHAGGHGKRRVRGHQKKPSAFGE
jgi:hypothetical protein